jgi:hypothetical protein
MPPLAAAEQKTTLQSVELPFGCSGAVAECSSRTSTASAFHALARPSEKAQISASVSTEAMGCVFLQSLAANALTAPPIRFSAPSW